MKIKEYLRENNREAITIRPGETLKAVIQKLVENNIGALPVCDDAGNLTGIISERDVLKECLNKSGSIDTVLVQDVMSRQVAVAAPDDDLEYATSVMKQKDIRHLPIMVDSKIVGMLSMRDIVNLRLKEAEAEIRYEGLLRHRIRRRMV